LDDAVKALITTPLTAHSTGQPSMRMPLVAPAIALAAGISLGMIAPMSLGFWIVLGALALTAAIVTFREKRLHLASTLATLLAAMAMGAVHVQLSGAHVSENHIATFTPERPMLATVTGRVITAPKVLKQLDQPGFARPDRTAFVLEAETIGPGPAPRQTSGLVRVTIDSAQTNLLIGQRVEIVGRIARFPTPDNPGQMDWSKFAHRSGVFVKMSTPTASGATVIDESPMPWPSQAFWRLRASTRQHLLACGDADGGHLLGALLLGERDPALRSLNDTMAQAGIAHFLSISGLHVGVFLGFVYFICRLVQLPPRRSAWIVLIVLAIYMLLAEPRPPLLRSAIMAAAMCLSVITHRRYASLNALAAAAIVLLLIDPMQILSAGFQLSFAIVVGLIILHEPLRWLLFGRWLGRRGLMVFRNNQQVRRWMWFKLGDAMTNMIAMCLAAYLTAAPLVAYHFGLFSPYAALLSILVFPLVLAVLVPGYIAIALAWPMPNLAASFQTAALSAAEFLAWTVEAIGQLPLLSTQLASVGAAWTAICYATIIAIWQSSRFRFGRAVAAILLIATIGLGAYTQRPAQAPDQGSASLDMLDIGAGQCVLLHSSSGKTWLIDAGTQSGTDVWDQTLRPFLHNQRLGLPDGAFVSHANTDHYNALVGLLGQGRLDTIYINEYFGQAGTLSNAKGESIDKLPQAEADMIDLMVNRRCKIVRLAAGATVELDAETTVEVLWPPASRPADLSVNDTSLVLRVSCGGKRILFPGDVERSAQEQLLSKQTDLDADILVMPHHGAWTKSLRQFFNAVSPEVVLLSSPRGLNRYYANNPARDEFIETLTERHRLYSTSKHGWIRLTFSKEGTIRAETMHPDR